MRYVLRPLWLVIVIIVLAFPVASYAQDDAPAPVLIQGTPELEALVAAVRDAYVEANPEADVQIDPGVGLRGAFDALCRGEVDVVMSTEPIDDSHVAACDNAGQNFIETVLAYEAVVLLTTPEAELTCASQDALFSAWQLGAPQEVLWSDLGVTAPLETPVAFYGTDELSKAHMLFRSLVPAEDLRDDLQTADPATILSTVQEAGSSAFGFMSLADLDAADPDGAAIPLAIEDANLNCVAPSVETLADRSYPLARTDYLYVNAESANREEVRAFLDFALADEAGAGTVALEQGYMAAAEETYRAGLDNLINAAVGRTFTRPLTPVSISTAEPGTVTIAGTSVLRDLTNPIQANFNAEYTGADVQVDLLGDTAGWQAFCTGAADVLQTTRDATAEEQALCEENGIEPYTLELGYEALALAVPAGADWIECLEAETAAALFRAGSDETPAANLWSEVNADWPETDILFVLPPFGSGETDFLTLNLLGDLTFPFRVDADVEHGDPLYRAQGVANTDNGITYAWWSESQGSEADVKWLAVDAGEGCVAPSPETFEDGTYPLSYPVRYHFSRASFDNGLVRALLWSFFSETAISTLAEAPFAGLDVEQLRGALRDEAFQMLVDVEAQAVEEPPTDTEPTADPTSEGTEEVTEEATEEPAAEATPEATEDVSEDATEEPAADPTVEPTEASD